MTLVSALYQFSEALVLVGVFIILVTLTER